MASTSIPAYRDAFFRHCRVLTLVVCAQVPPECEVEPLAASFAAHLAEELEKGRLAEAAAEAAWAALPAAERASKSAPRPPTFPPVTTALRRSFQTAFIRAGLYKLGSDTLQFTPAILVGACPPLHIYFSLGS